MNVNCHTQQRRSWPLYCHKLHGIVSPTEIRPPESTRQELAVSPSRRLLGAHLLGLTNPKVGTWMQHIQCNQGDLRKVTSRRETLEICITFRYLTSHYITLQAYTNKWHTLAIHNSISTLWFSICHIISISSMISIVCGKNPPSVPRWPLSLGPQCTRPTILDNPCKLLVPERGYPKIASFLVCVYYIYMGEE